MALEVEYVVGSSLFTRRVGEIGQIGITASGPGNDGAKSNGPMVAAGALDLRGVVRSGVAEDVVVGGTVENCNVRAFRSTVSDNLIEVLCSQRIGGVRGPQTEEIFVAL